jgi:hypothetical protein
MTIVNIAPADRDRRVNKPSGPVTRPTLRGFLHSEIALQPPTEPVFLFALTSD